MIDKYYEEQPLVVTLLNNSLKNNKIVQAYLFYSKDIDYIFEFAKEFSKDLICDTDENKNNIIDRIDKNIYSELKIIETDQNIIKKEQLIELQNSVKNKPIEGNKIVYIIKNCEKLNSSSANSILKFLEEPADDIIAILLTDNLDSVIGTIKSRCQIINFKNKIEEENINIEYLVKNSIYQDKLDDDEVQNIINDSIDFISDIEKKGINTFIYIKNISDYVKSSQDVGKFINVLIYAYSDILYKKIGKKISYFNNYESFITNISDKNELDDIIKKIYILENIRFEAKFNVNSKLLIDKLIIELGGIYE